jgi:hypothetical protein
VSSRTGAEVDRGVSAGWAVLFSSEAEVVATAIRDKD